MIAAIGLIVVLLLLLVFFSSAETALTGASKPLMHQMEMDGDRRAALVNRLRARRETLLGSILIGNTLAQILSSSLATGIAVAIFGDAGIAYVTVALTILILVFCEVLPKTYALRRSSRVALALAPIVRVVEWVLGPIAKAVQALVDGLLSLFGINLGEAAAPEEALAELRGAITIHSDAGEVHDERKMLHSILDLGNVTVGEIMVHRRNLITLDAGQPWPAIMDQAAASPVSRLPLWKENPDNILGVLHTKTLLRAMRAHPEDINKEDVLKLAQPPWFIPESTSLLDQMQAFRTRREHFAMVVDEYGTLQGVVTLEDILEEIVGHIPNEHDSQISGVRTQPDGSLIVDGAATIRDLNREFDWHLSDEHAATIAGLLLHEARMIPEVGRQFLFHGFRFEVLRRNRNQITSIRIVPARPAAEITEGVT